ncbi:MAG TPA: hypothetical protein PLJ60_14480 [Chryseolinea sp.]|nr:hypothetical protein [Chryseolinea sp.]
MTHVKNAEAFARLISFCNGYGGKYNPARPNLQMDALVNQMAETQAAIENVRIFKTAFDNEANTRKQIFQKLRPFVASVLRTLEASGATPEKLDDARTFVQLITGKTRRKSTTIPATTEVKPVIQRSHLQLAYVSKADAFAKLIKAVMTEPLYQPREIEFGQEVMDAKLIELNLVNRKVSDARALWSKAIIERNKVMYDKEVSIIKTARSVKKYVRAIYGPSSQEYALLKALDIQTISID